MQLFNRKKNTVPLPKKPKQRAVDIIGPWAKKTARPGVMTNIGGFSGLFQPNFETQDHVLVSATGSLTDKLELLLKYNLPETAGKDLVAVCLNQLAALGGSPLFFMNAAAMATWNGTVLEKIVSGISFSCLKAGCALLGGDTTVSAGLLAQNATYLSGFAVGEVEKAHIPNPATIQAGDVIFGLPSSGLHTEGYPQALYILKEVFKLKEEERFRLAGMELLPLLLQPTRLYTNIISKLVKQTPLSAVVPITSGGMTENIPRIMPSGLAVYIEKYRIIPELFNIMINEDRLSRRDLFTYFNMGIGMLLISPASSAAKVEEICAAEDEPLLRIGEVKASDKMIIEAITD